MLTVIGSAIGGIKKTLRGLFFSPGFPRSMRAFLNAPASNSDALIGDNMVRSKEGVISSLRFVNLSDLDIADGESMSVDLVAETQAGTLPLLTTPFILGAGAPVGSAAATGKAGVYDFTSLLVPGFVLLETALVVYNTVYAPGTGVPSMSDSTIWVDYYGDEQP
jgi:hypothetical protein